MLKDDDVVDIAKFTRRAMTDNTVIKFRSIVLKCLIFNNLTDRICDNKQYEK